MDDRPRQAIAPCREDGDHPVGGIAFVDEDREAAARGEVEVLLEAPLLLISRRKVAEEVEAAFAHGDAFRLIQEVLEPREPVVFDVRGMMRVDSGRKPRVPG